MLTEYQLENQLINKLQKLGFSYAEHTKDANTLLINLKVQLEKLNNTTFSNKEFKQILNHLNSGDIFEKALNLRDRFVLHRDDDTQKHIIFFNSKDFGKNNFQVANQIQQKGPQYLNRYDVTLLINGLPLVQIELKRPGVEMKQAFNQILRYKKHTFAGTLFDFAQIFIITDGVNTKYFANNTSPKFFNTFFWTDVGNNKITNLMDFSDAFLNPKFLAEYIYKFIVLAKAERKLYALRPYQYYASTKILERVKTSDKFGYIWHTTGSGKTLTAFKTAQLLKDVPEVKKILFVVDRRDLDIQTTAEFNKFSPGSVDSTTNTRKLVKQLADNNIKLIVTTLQKLDRALNNPKLHSLFAHLRNQKIVIIFDECHRSQFGTTHANIRRFFKKAQLFGFTGTPIFAKNSVDNKTTATLFEECLHKYIITHAIDDGNVLGFAVEYIGKYSKPDTNTIIDYSIETSTELDKASVKKAIISWDRVEKIVNYVLEDLPRKLKVPKDAYGNLMWSRAEYNALFATSSIDLLRRYYSVFKSKKPKDMVITAVFSFAANEEDREDGSLEENIPQTINTKLLTKSNREFLDEIIKDYNNVFGTNFSTQDFGKYYKDVQARIKTREIHLTLVVNMLLTGFDSAKLNTLYVDKNLKYHGLIQAFSRTNRLDGLNKPHGNIVSFRNIKTFVDEALALYGDENAKDIVIGHNYEDIKHKFLQTIEKLENFLDGLDPQLVDLLKGNEQKLEFIKIFRQLMRLKASLETFVQFSWKDLQISEETYWEFASKYKDLANELQKTGIGLGPNPTPPIPEPEPVQLSFELELLQKDIIDYDYILNILKQLKQTEHIQPAYKKLYNRFQKLLEHSETWKNRKNILANFVESALKNIEDTTQIDYELRKYLKMQKEEEIARLSQKLNITKQKLKALIEEYSLTKRLPSKYDILLMLTASNTEGKEEALYIKKETPRKQSFNSYALGDSADQEYLRPHLRPEEFQHYYNKIIYTVEKLVREYEW